MTIANSYAPTKVSGDGVLTNFSYDFRIYESDDIIVTNILKVAPFTEVPQVLGVDYSVNINLVSEGGSIDYLITPPPATYWVFIESALEDTQPTAFPLDAKLREESVERMGDRITRLVQQNSEQIGRALIFRTDTDLTGITITVPPPEADALIGWNAAGDELENKPGFAATIAAVQALADAAALSAAAASASETAAGVSETNAAADAAQVAADLIATNQDTIDTAADAVSTAADVISSAANAAAALASELAAAASATSLVGTSTTSVLIGTGAKAFTTQAGKFFDAGNFLLITSDADPTNFMHGQVTSYAGTALTVNVTDIGGAGTFADWTIRLSSVAGVDGAATNFLSMTDTPGTYVGQAGFVATVNPGETGLIFQAASGGGSGDINQAIAFMGG